MAPPVTQAFDPPIGEYGQDYGVKVGTPIYSPIAGTISTEDNGKQAWGKRVIVFANDASAKIAGVGAFAVGHLTSFAVSPGQKISAGQLIGYSGGAPSDPSSGVSTGPHVEAQFFGLGGSLQNPINPTTIFGKFASWEEAIFSGAGALAGSSAGSAAGAANSLNPLDGVAAAINSATSSLMAMAWRVFFFVIGAVIGITGLWLIVRGDVEKVQEDVLDKMEKAASAGEAIAPEAAVAA